MPTKNVYVSDDDVALFDKAAALAGGVSAAVAAGLRLYVAQQERAQKKDDMTTIDVDIQDGAVVSTRRFIGRRLLRYEEKEGLRARSYRVYATERGQLAAHIRDDALTSSDEENPVWNDPATWRGGWWKVTDRSLAVYPDIESMVGALPDELVEAVRRALSTPPVELLDI